jgi:hypothetical protein
VGHPLALESLRVSLPEAIAAVKADLAAAADQDHTQKGGHQNDAPGGHGAHRGLSPGPR